MRLSACLLSLGIATTAAADEKETIKRLDEELERYAGTLMKIRDGFVKRGDGILTESLIAEYEKLGDAAGCRTATKAARDAAPRLVVRGVGSVGRVPIGDFEAKVCGALATIVPKFAAEARIALADHKKEALAKYVAVGIGGAKLDLIAKYEGVSWRLVGGKRTDDPKELAQAAVMFQWLEGADLKDASYTIHTIRKYRFKGNALLGTSENQYRRKNGADVGDVFR